MKVVWKVSEPWDLVQNSRLSFGVCFNKISGRTLGPLSDAQEKRWILAVVKERRQTS